MRFKNWLRPYVVQVFVYVDIVAVVVVVVADSHIYLQGVHIKLQCHNLYTL